MVLFLRVRTGYGRSGKCMEFWKHNSRALKSKEFWVKVWKSFGKSEKRHFWIFVSVQHVLLRTVLCSTYVAVFNLHVQSTSLLYCTWHQSVVCCSGAGLFVDFHQTNCHLLVWTGSFVSWGYGILGVGFGKVLENSWKFGICVLCEPCTVLRIPLVCLHARYFFFFACSLWKIQKIGPKVPCDVTLYFFDLWTL